MAKATTKKGAAAPATAKPAPATTAPAATAQQAAPATTAPAATAQQAAPAKPAAPALPWQGVQNGVQPPKRAGLCAAVWELTTAGMQAGANGNPPTMPPLAAVKAAAAQQGLNATNVAIEYYRCRQWHGVRGRQGKAQQGQQA